MYLRETKRRNRDGSVVSYLALAHNQRDPESGTPKARIVHNFGRADQIDRAALVRLMHSISRWLDPAEAALTGAAAHGRGAEVPPAVADTPSIPSLADYRSRPCWGRDPA